MGVICMGRDKTKRKVHRLWEVPPSFDLKNFESNSSQFNPENEGVFPKINDPSEVSNAEQAVQCNSSFKTLAI